MHSPHNVAMLRTCVVTSTVMIAGLSQLVAAFQIPFRWGSLRDVRLSPLGTMFDFDYEPPNPDAGAGSTYQTNLPSVFPDGMPAGLRGEAVRSAIRSRRCVAWTLHDTPLARGL